MGECKEQTVWEKPDWIVSIDGVSIICSDSEGISRLSQLPLRVN